MSQIHGENMGSPAAIVDEGGRLYVNSVLNGTKIRSSGLVIYPRSHDRIIEGKEFICVQVFNNVNKLGSAGILFGVGSVNLHIRWSTMADADTRVKFFEDVSVSDSGTSCIVFNLNRTSNNLINSKGFYDPIITNSGTLLLEDYLLGGSISATKFASPEMSLGTQTGDIILSAGSVYWAKFECESDRLTNIIFKGVAHEH